MKISILVLVIFFTSLQANASPDRAASRSSVVCSAEQAPGSSVQESVARASASLNAKIKKLNDQGYIQTSAPSVSVTDEGRIAVLCVTATQP